MRLWRQSDRHRQTIYTIVESLLDLRDTAFHTVPANMRLWSISPKYLDSKGLVALWREGLLAQKVLAGKTKGYKAHPQLLRFKETSNPLGFIASYLSVVVDEADSRGYNFNRQKITNKKTNGKIAVTNGQLEYEFLHLQRKLETRDPSQYQVLLSVDKITPHTLFSLTDGGIAVWEVTG
jgi:hypothetical protein